MEKSGDVFTSVPNSFWDLTADDIDGTEVKFDSYKGAKAFLIVNVASACGYTPNYSYLGKFYETYKDKGLVVMGFPCNQFGAQESGTNKDIKSFCSLKYKITFPMFSKIEVNGKNTHPVYRFLRTNSSLNNGDGTISPIKWNFNSFLVNGDGQVLKWFASGEKPANIEKEFLPLLS